MNSLEDSAKIFRYHRDMISWHGLKSSFALGWRGDHDQQVRFSILSQIADLDNQSVLDAGCGYADLFPYLKGLYPQLKSYHGIEQIPELLDEAVQRYRHLPNTSFNFENFLTIKLPLYDYVFVSGALNYGSSTPGFIYRAIEHLYQSCNKGLGFNLLKEMNDGTLTGYDQKDILEFCRTLTPYVVLADDYTPNDFTVSATGESIKTQDLIRPAVIINLYLEGT